MTSAVFLQLLLLCGLSGAAFLGDTVDRGSLNEISPQVVNREGGTRTSAVQTDREGTTAAASALSQQACPCDIHAVLRDMTALMTEQRVELRHTQLELKAVTERLRDSENLFKASLETIKVRSNATESVVQALQRQNEVKQVAFSASLLASGHGHTGPYNTLTILVYRHVITNVGNAYNQNTGFFTAPVKGVYQFNVFLHGVGASHATGVFLVKNGQNVVIAYEHQRSYSVNPSNGASLLLEAGDVVYVRLCANTWIYDSGNHHSTFSGHLLFTV